MPTLLYLVESAAPDQPPPGKVVVYAKTDKSLYLKTDQGVESSFSPVIAATQAQQEAASSVLVFTSPGRQQHHPSAAKAWVRMNWSGGTPTIGGSYNVTSLTDTGTGAVTVNLTAAFSAATTYNITTGYQSMDAATQQQLFITSLGTSSFVLNYYSNGVATDNTNLVSATAFGDQA